MEEIAESIASDIEREDDAYESHINSQIYNESKSNYNKRAPSININNIAVSQSSNSVNFQRSI